MAVKKAKKSESVKKTTKAKKTETIKEEKREEKREEKNVSNGKYFYAVGRRKTSVSQARIFEKEKAGDGDFIVNNKKFKEYFQTVSLQNIVTAPLKSVGLGGKFGVSVLVRGGGTKGQAEATRLGISRAIVKYNQEFRKTLKDLGFLVRDPRMVERKKPGLKKARRSPQWAKR
jgi:small subunit ribosomal protein S9